MGDVASKIFNRFFDYPLKPMPYCVHRHENVLIETGEKVETEYEKLNNKFNKQLVEKRKEIYENGNYDSLLMMFPDWNETTIAYMHSLFLIFSDEDKKILNFKSFEGILQCMGDDSTIETRRKCFDDSDKDKDGWINYLEFLYAIYNYHPPDRCPELTSLCIDVAERAVRLNSTSMDSQLENGVF